MRRLVPVILALLVAATVPAAADEPLRAELQAVLDRYYAASRKGDVNAALALRSAETRREVAAETRKDPKFRTGFAAMLKAMTPSSYTVEHVQPDRRDPGKALMIIIGQPSAEARAPAGQAPQPVRIEIEFTRVKNAWIIEDMLFRASAAAAKAAPEDGFEPIEAYDETRSSSVGGRIVRVRFADDHTLVVVNVFDEEACLYLPSRAALEAEGFAPDNLAPFRVVSAGGMPHRSKPYKTWVTELEMLD